MDPNSTRSPRPLLPGDRLATEDEVSRLRERACVEQWPDAQSGDYNPNCCRFPKSCSPHGNTGYARLSELEEDPADPTRPLPDEDPRRVEVIESTRDVLGRLADLPIDFGTRTLGSEDVAAIAALADARATQAAREARADERARVVAWLLGLGDGAQSEHLRLAARRISEGAHE